MPYKALADIVVLIHLLWIVFLILGAVWGRKKTTVRIFHLSGLGFAVLMQAMGWYCPLTHLEAWLREKHAPGAAYPGSFIVHYAERLIYIDLSPKTIFIMTVLLVALNIVLYLGWKKRGTPCF